MGNRLRSFLERSGAFFFFWRNQLYAAVLLVLFLGFHPAPLHGHLATDRWMDLCGLAIVLLGQGLRVLVIGYAYIIRGGRQGKVYSEELVTRGVFNHSRNPLYLGNLIILLGLFVIHNNPWVYGIGIPFFLFAYSSIVAAEEAYLSRKHGEEYEAYRRQVPRWIPRWKGFSKSVEGMRFDWRRVVLKEYGTFYSWVATTIVLLAYETMLGFQSYQMHRLRHELSVMFFAATLGWLGVRHWKKSVQAA